MLETAETALAWRKDIKIALLGKGEISGGGENKRLKMNIAGGIAATVEFNVNQFDTKGRQDGPR